MPLADRARKYGPLHLDKGKIVVSSIPSPGQGDIHQLAEATSRANPKAAVEGPAVQPAVPA